MSEERCIDFVFGIHCHQPVGNFEHVFEEAYQSSYLPFINIFKKHPTIKLTFHYSGILLKWFEKKHPEFLVLLKEMLDSGQAEVIGGGFYEPILPSIPEQDQINQLRFMSAFLKEKFGYRAKGTWLAERVWEPHLARILNYMGVEYTLVDDHHFRIAGLKEEEIYGYFTTEEEGLSVNIFPINERLRYLIPFKNVEQILEFFRANSERIKDEKSILLTLVDDGEKFGVWPGTHKWVYEEGWLEKFLFSLEQNSWIRTLTLSEAVQRHISRGIIYLPPASYKEMLEWSGGFWRNFLVKYPEANNLHKKMLFVSSKVKKIEEFASDRVLREARDELMQGQCNDAYWHGIFGGLYLNYLRSACYTHLIRAESIAEKEMNQGRENWLSVEETDFNKDGKPEVLISSRLLNVYVSPFSGGQIFEIDYKGEPYFNITDTLSRRPEPYHEKIKESMRDTSEKKVKSIHEMFKVKKEGLEELLKYDSYRRVSLIDHLLKEEIDILSFRDSPRITGFTLSPYRFKIKKDSRQATLQMIREEREMNLEKNISLEMDKSCIKIHYALTNKKEEANFWFGVEFNFSLLAGEAPDRYYEIPGMEPEDSRLSSSGRIENIKQLRLVDKWQGIYILLEFSNTCNLWRFPIYTVSQSESGIEQTYQGSTIVPNWKVIIPGNGRWETSINLEINRIV